jgi:hypothetical protein
VRAVPDPGDHLDVVGTLAGALERLGLDPVLVGGMALVALGSRRVTRDFDFVVEVPGDRLSDLVALVYDHGLELVSRQNADGEVTATIANRRVALSRLSIDRPASAYFYDSRSGLRVDLLFDFPLAAAVLARRAPRVRMGAHTVRVADERDLLELKRLAKADRDAPGDAEDIAFLERRIKPRT